ncbi:uncharacterized protein FIBRA_00463 [Fibroporia radiculosa]|uniref:F-box domain-containing protein n=1 Tax=Fibroporia radiculosa TaxID=599839 RepID=J4GHT9_9APHY|nr:uncharacterized protein FIBRA_00463 [Fibroporia radiculosa]CCL98465.1 predicted protein [Fibroporia radiculosa]
MIDVNQRGGIGCFRNLSIDEQEKTKPIPLVHLPIELWEKVFDLLAEDGRLHALTHCALTCKAWTARCRWHLSRHIILRDKKQAHRVVKAIQSRHSRVNASEAVTLTQPFAFSTGRKLPQVDSLTIGDNAIDLGSVWHANSMHVDAFTHFRVTFESLTRLTLVKVEFPSAIVFGRLICSFPHLTSLTCHSLKLKTTAFVQGRVLPPNGFALTRVDLHNADDVVEFLVVSLISAAFQHVRWVDPRCLVVDPTRNVSTNGLQRLLRSAGTSLRAVDLTYGLLSDGDAKGQLQLAELDLKTNVGLEAISLAIYQPRADVDVWTESWSQLYIVMSTGVSALKLRQVTISFVSGMVYARPDNLWQHRLQELQAMPDLVYAKFDQLFSKSDFPRLKMVLFRVHEHDGYRLRLRRSAMEDVPHEDQWRHALACRFPTLVRRDLLRTSVTMGDSYMERKLAHRRNAHGNAEDDR